MDGFTLDITAENIRSLQQLFPDVVSEGRIDFDRLRAALGAADALAPAAPEHYELRWAGKAAARREVQQASTATLQPDPAASVDFADTGHVLIEGENLEVLRVLQRGYFGKVKMIYIDPPYNTGSDAFPYPDDFAEEREAHDQRAGQRDELGQLRRQDVWGKNMRESARFHSVWLSMMWPRLYLCRNLLREDGVIFVSIDDNEVHNLRLLLNEVFGEENFVAQLVWQRSKKGDAKLVASVHEYVLCFARDKAALQGKGNWRLKKKGVDAVLTQYEALRQQWGADHAKIREAMQAWFRGLPEGDARKAHKHYNWSDDRGLYFAADFAGPDDGRASRPRHDIPHPVTGKSCKKPSTGWRWDENKTAWALAQKPPRIHFGPDESTIPNRKSYLAEISSEPFSSVFYRDGRSATLEVEGLVGKGVFPFPKNTEVLSELIELATGPDDLIMDFFAGSGSTGHAVMTLNAQIDSQRRFLLVQYPEPVEEKTEAYKAGYRTIADITRTRLAKVSQQLRTRAQAEGAPAPDLGFRYYRLVPSNFRQWRPRIAGPAELLTQLELFQQPLRAGVAAGPAMLTELLLKMTGGPDLLPLSVPVQTRRVGEAEIHDVAGGLLWLALAGLTPEVVAAAVDARPQRLLVPGHEFGADNPDELVSNARLQLADAGVQLQLL
ncbi:site-specific DNA-methyltransferase [Hymenobacter gummosus]|uniref:site-specific DNA-methyltransferase (adenine-specific) n=1 Tax=Hymenobacter gummosus TaxID=1776032 RepID=A0A431U3B5_9BACT|nr:site-specific DNA-methyltransferase [Hymenobacter gummosus]RTQ49987.1 site-specific DNA-methyltransferase [Hymenobacter gummosus]